MNGTADALRRMTFVTMQPAREEQHANLGPCPERQTAGMSGHSGRRHIRNVGVVDRGERLDPPGQGVESRAENYCDAGRSLSGAGNEVLKTVKMSHGARKFNWS